MRRIYILFVLCFISLHSLHAREFPQGSIFSSHIFIGGGFGMSFGSVSYIEAAPLIGYQITERLSGGASLLYRYKNDKRFNPNLKTSDYGASAFGRFLVHRPFVLHAEYEYLSYEFVNADLSTTRTGFNSFLGGGGITQPIGGRAALFVLGLYNFTYSSTSVNTPYNDPWMFRVGITYGF